MTQLKAIPPQISQPMKGAALIDLSNFQRQLQAQVPGEGADPVSEPTVLEQIHAFLDEVDRQIDVEDAEPIAVESNGWTDCYGFWHPPRNKKIGVQPSF